MLRPEWQPIRRFSEHSRMSEQRKAGLRFHIAAHIRSLLIVLEGDF
jgi:hypothetical protein